MALKYIGLIQLIRSFWIMASYTKSMGTMNQCVACKNHNTKNVSLRVFKMNKIECNGFSTKLILKDNALVGFIDSEIEILQYALESYGFLNCTCFGAKYSVSIESWITEIKKVYDVNCLKNEAVINALNKLV